MNFTQIYYLHVCVAISKVFVYVGKFSPIIIAHILHYITLAPRGHFASGSSCLHMCMFFKSKQTSLNFSLYKNCVAPSIFNNKINLKNIFGPFFDFGGILHPTLFSKALMVHTPVQPVGIQNEMHHTSSSRSRCVYPCKKIGVMLEFSLLPAVRPSGLHVG